jgi:hypothetical protein
MGVTRLFVAFAVAGGVGLASASAASASDSVRPRHMSSCQRLTGHDLAPARTVKLVRQYGQLVACVLPRGRVRLIAESDDIPTKSYTAFKLRAVKGGFVMFDESFNNAYIDGERTIVYRVRTGHRYAIAINFRGDASGPSEHFQAPVALIDARGHSVAAIVSTKPYEPDITIARFGTTGARQILDEGSRDAISARSLTQTADGGVSWVHSGVVQTAPFA